MKIKLILLLLTFTCAKSQVKLPQDQVAILKSEVQRVSLPYKTPYYVNGIVKDSVIIDSKVLIFDTKDSKLKDWCINTGALLKDEADKIFGNEDKLFNFEEKGDKFWTGKEFPGLKVSLFDENNRNPERLILKTSNIIYAISVPIIRKDGKYALIQSANEHDGDILSIYRKTNDGWVFYRKVQIYFI